jgi:minor histocompatibility antigen H13
MSYPDKAWLHYLSFLCLAIAWGSLYFVILPVTFNLALISISILYVGGHRSLRLLDHEAIPLEEKETISEGDAYKIPFIASISLGLFYIAFKYLDKETVNFILSFYFCLVGILSLTATFAPLISLVLQNPHRYELKFGISFTIAELLSFLLAIVLTTFYFQTKHYMLNNLLGISFSLQALERVSIGSYRIGCIILIGLFFYDIFWVFGTEVMVTVAKSFDAPIKLLFPRVGSLSLSLSLTHISLTLTLSHSLSLSPLTPSQVFPTPDLPAGKFSLLGLGDIVVPGIFLSLLLRYDAVRAQVDPVNAETKAFPKPYFYGGLVGYLFGIVLTVAVMYAFDSAQVILFFPPYAA